MSLNCTVPNTRVTAGVGDRLLALGEIGVGPLLVWWLHRRKIFLRP